MNNTVKTTRVVSSSRIAHEPKLLWLSLFTLFEDNIRSRRALMMLKVLKSRGVRVRIVTCDFCLDPLLRHTFLETQRVGILKEKPAADISVYDVYGMVCNLLNASAETPEAFGSKSLDFFYKVLNFILSDFSPDAVMGFGYDRTSVALRQEIRRRGIPYIYALTSAFNSTHDFAGASLVLTISRYTASKLRPAVGVRICTVGNFVDAQEVVAPARDPIYVTFINNTFTKGLAVFLRLALVCRRENAPIRFLVVQEHARFFQSIKSLRWSNGESVELEARDLPNVEVISHEGHDYRDVYALTKVLLMPSLWQENWGQIATEAIFNHIPVICTKSGGLPESVSGAGICLDLPRVCLEDMTQMPSFEDIKPWYAALTVAMNLDFTSELEASIAENALEKSTQRLLSALNPYLKL